MPGIWEMPAAGGEEKLVVEMPLPPTSNWQVRSNGIYYLSLSDRSVYLWDFTSRRSVRLISIPGLQSVLNGGFSLTPDAGALIYANVDSSTADIMMVEGFR
jgi:hypothetical protein